MATTIRALFDEWADPFPIPPSVDELPIDLGEPVESEFHGKQMPLLVEPIEIHFRDRKDVYAAHNMGIFYSAYQARHTKHRAPDALVVTGTDRRTRKAWVIWEEDGQVPDVVVEVSSPSTSRVDRVEKKAIYERIRIREYFIHDPMVGELLGYRLAEETREYVEIQPDAAGRLPCLLLGLRLGLWEGTYRGIAAVWSRWYTDDGVLLPTPEELRVAAETKAEQAEAKAEQAEAKAEQAEAKAERAEAKAEQADGRAAALAARLAAYEARFGQLPGPPGDPP